MNPLIFIILFFFTVVVVLIFYLFSKLQLIGILRRNLSHLEKTVNELDHQAKLIVKSDMELKLYQEAVEDKLKKLTFLKNLILSSIHILDEEKLLEIVREKVINDLGFQKGLILTFDDLDVRTAVNFNVKEQAIIKDFLAVEKTTLDTTPIIHGETEICKNLLPRLHSENILIGLIRARNTSHAVLILSHPLPFKEINQEDCSVFSIICMYLGQCVDNIKLFEDLYMAKKNLENKITERTNELIKSLRKIEEISKLKTNFISSVSHELRTPLTSVKGFSSLLVMGKFGELPSEAKRRLEQIDINVNKLVDMVNVLLDIARIESGKTEIKIAQADAAKLLRDVAELLTPQMINKKLRFSLSVSRPVMVYMDKNLIERVLINLFNNSIKFTPEGGSLNASCSITETEAVISIADSGVGMDKEDLQKLFQEFFRAKSTATMPGTGLGLSLVKHIIDIHKEKIWVESELGKGTTFFFTLKTTPPTLEKNIDAQT